MLGRCVLAFVVSAIALLAGRAGHAAQSAARPDQVTLKSGDVLRGTIANRDDSSVTLIHPELGTIAIPIENVQSFEVANSGDATLTSAPEAKTASAEQKSEWELYLSLALDGTFDTNSDVSVRAGGGAKIQSEQWRVAFTGEYYFRLNNDEATDNNLLLQGLQERYFGDSPWLIFAEEQYQFDSFQSWQHRISGHGGPGYRLVNTDAMQFTLRFGAGASYDAGDVHTWTPEALLAEDFAWTITRRQKILVNVSIAPSLNDLGEYRLQGLAEYAYQLDDSKKGLAFTAGLRDIYESKPAPGSTANDLRIYAGIRYDF